MPVNNPWLNYITRTYQQIKAQVLTNAQSLMPEITDHTEGNIIVKLIGVWSGIAEMLGYYIDNAARESFITTCRRYESGIRIARLHDYRVRGKIAATVDITFTTDVAVPSNFLIPVGTEVTTDEGVIFITTANATILSGQTTITVGAEQTEKITAIAVGTSDGTEGQEFVLSANVVDGSVVTRVNALTWSQKDTFGYSLSNDESFVQTVNEDGNIIIRFGDDLNGEIPVGGSAIECDYKETLGAGGNVPGNTLINITSPPALPLGVSSLTCTNPQRASGGNDIESLDELARHIPLALRTLMRAVNRQDYPDVAELAAGVARAGVLFDCGKYVEVYIVPNGGGIASSGLLATTQTWMNVRKMLTTQVVVKAAGEVRIVFNVDLKVLPQYSNSVVSNAVTAAMVLFLSYIDQTIGGSVFLGDIYQIIEGTEGVDHCTINVMTPTPYARPLNTTTTVLVWTPVIATTNLATDRWVITFTSNTNFQLLKNSVFQGNFTTGTPVVMPEVTFTITPGGYAANDKYEFYTYPYFGNLVLQETSLPVSLAGDITLNATGGV